MQRNYVYGCREYGVLRTAPDSYSYGRYGVGGPTYGNPLVEYAAGAIEKQGTDSANQGSIDDIFEDRLDLIRSKIDLILIQLEQRKNIHHEVTYRIERDCCRAYDLLFAWGTEIYRVDRDRLKIERMKFDLEQQKRRERTDYFNDTSLLNRELREALIQYQEEVQKNRMISGMEVSP